MIWTRFPLFGIASVILFSIGCGSNSTPVVVTPTNSASTVYLIQDNFNTFTSSILELTANAQGNVAPTATVNGPASTYYYAVAVDQSGNIYAGAETEVVNPNAVFEIFEYAAGATGTATPIRTINIPVGITSLAVDATGQIYALTQDGIYIYAANASGNATPIRQILPGESTSITTIDYPFGIAVDSQQNIYVANASNILVFSSTANGNVAPARTITWSNTQFGMANGVAVDANGGIFATTYDATPCPGVIGSCSYSSHILQFASGANGMVMPTNALTILPNSSFPNADTGAAGVAVDAAGNLYAQVSTITYEGLGLPSFLDAMSVEVFTPGQTGSSDPAQTITSTSWTDSDSWGFAIH
jgi:hypothetical protein